MGQNQRVFVEGDDYADGLRNAYEEIEVSLKEVTEPICPICDERPCEPGLPYCTGGGGYCEEAYERNEEDA